MKLTSVGRYLVVLLLAAISLQAATAEEPIPGPVVALFDDDPSGGIPEGQLGVFYDPDNPIAEDFIEEVPMEFKLPGEADPVGFRVLMYVVRNGRYNGMWIKLGGADWSKYKGGEIVFLMRRLDPKVDEYVRSV